MKRVSEKSYSRYTMPDDIPVEIQFPLISFRYLSHSWTISLVPHSKRAIRHLLPLLTEHLNRALHRRLYCLIKKLSRIQEELLLMRMTHFCSQVQEHIKIIISEHYQKRYLLHHNVLLLEGSHEIRLSLDDRYLSRQIQHSISGVPSDMLAYSKMIPKN